MAELVDTGFTFLINLANWLLLDVGGYLHFKKLVKESKLSNSYKLFSSSDNW
jgi:hypothetical protein